MEIGKNLQQSIDLYLKNFVTLLLAGLIAGILSTITLGILAGPLLAGLLTLCLKIIKGDKGEIGDIFSRFDLFLPTFIVTLMLWVAGIAIWIIAAVPVIGWLFMFVASPALSFIYFIAIGLIVGQKKNPMEAVRKSFDYFAADAVKMWVYSLVFGFIGGIGAIFFGIGAFLTMPIMILGFSIAYQQLSSAPVTIFAPDKKNIKIIAIVFGVLIIAGLISITVGIGLSSKKAGSGLASRILSSTTGQNVKIDDSGETITIGNLTMGEGIPKNFPKDVPIYPKSEVGGHMSGTADGYNGSTITLASKDGVEKVFKFYTKEMKNQGWEYEQIEMGGMKMLNLTKENRKAMITITPNDNTTDILIAIGIE